MDENSGLPGIYYIVRHFLAPDPDYLKETSLDMLPA